MNSNPKMRKILQVAEQVQQPLHVPFIVGNQCYVITQQDVRRIEDSRFFSYNKVNTRGELLPMDTSEVRCNDLLTNMQSQCKQPFDTNNQLDMGMLSELLARVYNVSAELQKQQQQQQQQQAAQLAIQNFQSNNQQHIIPTMTVTPTTNSGLTSESATLQQQLDWAKACNTMLTPTTMYPLHQTSATSTTEIAPSRCESERTSKRGQCCSRGCNTIVLDTSLQSPQRSSSRSATCLCARQQAKQRKMAQFMN